MTVMTHTDRLLENLPRTPMTRHLLDCEALVTCDESDCYCPDEA